MAITVSIVEDNRGTRESLAELCNETPSLRCVGAYSTGEAAVRQIPANMPDVALVDIINLPGMNGIECVARRLQGAVATPANPHAHYLLGDRFDFQFIARRRQRLPAQEPPGGGVGPGRRTGSCRRRTDDHANCPQTGRTFSADPSAGPGSGRFNEARTEEILALLSKGFLYKEIGDRLGIGLTTVRTLLKHIYEKLHVQSRTEAAVKLPERDEDFRRIQIGEFARRVMLRVETACRRARLNHPLFP